MFPARVFIVVCPTLEDITRGSVTVTGVLPGSIAVYCCDNGFELVGESVRRCTSNLRWSGNSTICRRKY